MGTHGETRLFLPPPPPPLPWASLPRGLFISTKLPLEGQMLLAKTGPWVAHRQINWGARLGRGLGGGNGCRWRRCWGGISPGKPVGAQLCPTTCPS